MADFEEVKATVAAVRKDFGSIQILVNSAGIIRDGLIPMMREAAFDAVLDTNLKGTFNMIRHVSAVMLRAKEGCIVNLASVSGLMGNAGQCNYAASKAGVVGLTKSVAKELASKGIRYNAIGEALRLIRHGYADAVITGGAEASIDPVGIAGFINMKALSTAEDPNAASLPFDARRGGFVIGEGAGALVLEEYEHAKARGAKIYGEVCGYGSTCDAYHITAPTRKPRAAQKPWCRH